MADGNFDPCECLWSHDSAMRRLLGLLRSSQSYCTDNECFGDMPGPEGAPPQSNMFFMVIMGWAIMAVMLYFLRPGSLRGRGDSKPSNNQGPNDPPPPAVN